MKKINFKILSEYPLEIRILIIAAAGGILFAILTGLFNLFLDLGSVLIATSVGTAIVGFITLYFAMVKKQYKVPAYFGILSLMIFLYPYMWIVNGGSHGPMFFFMIFNAVFCAVLLAYLNYRLVLVLQLTIVYGLLAFEYKYPAAIVPYPSVLTRSVDIGLSFTIVFLVTFFMVVRIMNEYTKNIRELEEVKAALTHSNEKLTLISETDELTGISNRRCIMSILSQHLYQNAEAPISLIMMDIDFFKKINDTYGHSVGDDVIRKVSQTMSESIRATDAIGRIGGEEFLIILPGTSLENALAKAEHMRQRIESLNWSHQDMHVTISGGVYCKGEHDTLDTLLDQVDARLYASKNKGRNQISK